MVEEETSESLLLEVGYQKSGNTWLIFILANLFAGVQSRWEDYVRLIPNWDKVVTDNVESPINWIRGHFNYQPLEILDRVEGAIYIMRHPYDICISSFRYRAVADWDLDISKYSEDAKRKALTSYINLFLDNCGDPAFNDINGGTLIDNVQSWLDLDQSFRVVPIRYEALLCDTTRCIRSILHALSITRFTDAQIHHAIKAASVGRMRSLDKANFLGKVQAGQWHEYFSDEQLRRGADVFDYHANVLGYCLDKRFNSTFTTTMGRVI